MPDDLPRVDELFSRAVVAQLAEQRAQRETFAELERKLEALERLVTERLSELSKLLRGGEVEMRLDLLEDGLRERIAGLEQAVQVGPERLDEISARLSQLEETVRSDEHNQALTMFETTLKRRLSQLEDAVRVEDTSRRLSALELAMTERLSQLEQGLNTEATTRRLDALEQSLAERFAELEGSVRADQVGTRLGGLEHSIDERLSQPEETVRKQDLAQRLGLLEQAMDERLGHLEESVRSEEIGPRLKAIELAVDERSHRPEAAPDTVELDELLGAVDQIVRDRMNALVEASGVGRLEALDEAVGDRLARLEGSLRRLEEHTMSRLEDLKEAGKAAEAGILERIIAESQVVGAHFQAVRPVVEAAAEARPELKEALAEVRELVQAARSGGEVSPGDTGPFPADVLRPPSEGEEPDTVFLSPEETPIPERRFGGIRPRRDKPPPGV